MDSTRILQKATQFFTPVAVLTLSSHCRWRPCRATQSASRGRRIHLADLPTDSRCRTRKPSEMEKAADAADSVCQTRLCYFSQLVLILGPEHGKLCVKSALLTLLSTPELSAPSRFPCCVFFYLVMKHSRRWRPPICGSKMFEPYFRQ